MSLLPSPYFETELTYPDGLDEILFYLNLLRFINPNRITEIKISQIEDFLRILKPIDTIRLREPEFIDAPQNIIIDVPDVVMKIAYLRTARDISVCNNSILYKKVKYKFDNVFSNETSDLILEITDFINKRVDLGKTTSIILYAYSGAGKSTITRGVIGILNATRYKLFEIYLNKTYVYFNGKKIEVDDVSNDKYIFQSDPTTMTDVLSKFSKVSTTEGNAVSSRAHTFIKIYMEGAPEITICDLCGNEKITHTSRISLFKKDTVEKETLYINKSLFDVSQFMRDPARYKNNKSTLVHHLKDIKNILFCLIFHDNENMRCYSSSHLVMFKDLFKSNKN